MCVCVCVIGPVKLQLGVIPLGKKENHSTVNI